MLCSMQYTNIRNTGVTDIPSYGYNFVWDLELSITACTILWLTGVHLHFWQLIHKYFPLICWLLCILIQLFTCMASSNSCCLVLSLMLKGLWGILKLPWILGAPWGFLGRNVELYASALRISHSLQKCCVFQVELCLLETYPPISNTVLAILWIFRKDWLWGVPVPVGQNFHNLTFSLSLGCLGDLILLEEA